MATQKQIDANRANALNSTGPNTPAGKAAVRLNALQHGLTARDAVLPFEDKDQFDEFAKSYEEHFKPLGPVEILLVQHIVMAAWRLCRVRGMETAAFELRLAEHASGLDHECRGLSGLHRLASVFLRDVRDANSLTVLARYETRVERSFYRALHELQRLRSGPENKMAKQSQSAPEPLPQKDLPPRRESGTADNDAGQEDQHPAHHDLQRRADERRIHEVMADVADGGQFNRHDNARQRKRETEVGNQERQRVADPAGRGH